MRLTLTHQQMTPPPASVATNPYHEGNLIFAMTTPHECTNKLAPRWKGPFLVKRVPNPYQVTYEDGLVWHMIHVNHAKPAKTPATGFPAPLPTPEPPKPTLGYLLRSLQRPLSRRQLPPPQPADPTAGPPQPAAAPPAATPPSSRQSACTAANRNSVPRAVQQPPPAPGRANENSQPGQQLRRSARLTPRACAIKSPPQPAAALLHSQTLRWLAHTRSPWTITSALGVRKTLTPSQVFSWKTCTVAIRSTSSLCSSSSTPCPRKLAIPLALHSEDRSPLKDINVCVIRCELRYGGSCHRMGSSGEHRVESSITWHARDGVWSCEGVM